MILPLILIAYTVLSSGKETRQIYGSEYPVIDQNFHGESSVNIITSESGGILHSVLIEIRGSQ